MHYANITSSMMLHTTKLSCRTHLRWCNTVVFSSFIVIVKYSILFSHFLHTGTTLSTSSITPGQSNNSTRSSTSNKTVFVAILGPVVVLAVLCFIFLIIFLFRRQNKSKKPIDFGNLQNVVNSSVNKEDYELQNPDYNFNLSNKSIKYSRPIQQDDIKAPVSSSFGSSSFAGENTFISKENTTDDEKSYDDIEMQTVRKISSCPASSHSPPEESKLSETKNVTPKSSPPSKTPVYEECLTTSDILSESDIGQIDGNTSPAMYHNLLSEDSLSKPKCHMESNHIYKNVDVRSFCSNEYEGIDYSEPAYVNSISETPVSDEPKFEGLYSEQINPSDFMEEYTDKAIQGIGKIYAPVYAEPLIPAKFHQPLIEVTHNNIQEREILGCGQFGQVILASTKGLSLKDLKQTKDKGECRVSILVAVKKLFSNANKGQQEAFKKEVRFMSQLNHENIVRMLGVCSSEPAFIMMEYMEEGDLNQFLQRYSEIVSSGSVCSGRQISTSTLIYMATQIASAMKYLAALNFVHRDLATRNCLVGIDFAIKLADFGLSRNLYESNYYRIRYSAILPIRWMATESYRGKFSEKTDVWSFGVTMWELFTLANQQPYSEMADKEVIKDAIKGFKRQLLPKPNECPESVYQIMMQCWKVQPEQRSTFAKLHDQLFGISM